MPLKMGRVSNIGLVCDRPIHRPSFHRHIPFVVLPFEVHPFVDPSFHHRGGDAPASRVGSPHRRHRSRVAGES